MKPVTGLKGPRRRQQESRAWRSTARWPTPPRPTHVVVHYTEHALHNLAYMAARGTGTPALRRHRTIHRAEAFLLIAVEVVGTRVAGLHTGFDHGVEQRIDQAARSGFDPTQWPGGGRVQLTSVRGGKSWGIRVSSALMSLTSRSALS